LADPLVVTSPPAQALPLLPSLSCPMLSALLLALAVLVGNGQALFQGAFHSNTWKFLESEDASWKDSHHVKFMVALKKQNIEEMHQHFLAVSNPRSSQYGKYLSKEEVAQHYGPSPDMQKKVKEFFSAIPSAQLRIPKHSDLWEITANVAELEEHLKTKLEFVSHVKTDLYPQKAIRAQSELSIPADIAHGIHFISLNSPVNFLRARGAKSLKSAEVDAAAPVSVTAGNEAALVYFKPTCAGGAVNMVNPPCTGDAEVPDFEFVVKSYANDPSNPYLLPTNPFYFSVPNSNVYCYNNSKPYPVCNGIDTNACVCTTQVMQIADCCCTLSNYLFML
jgi:hypothetical protein